MTNAQRSAEWRAASPERRKLSARVSHLRRMFDLTLEQYHRLLTLQKGVCAICHLPETTKRNGRIKNLAVDHDHESFKVRGLLCAKCNIAIGILEKSNVMKHAAAYIRRATKRNL
jgi:hypothetical protein